MAVIRAKTWPSRSGGERPEARFTLTPCDGGSRLVLAGDWTATRVANAASSLGAAVSNHRIALLDVEDVERLDTAGVFVLTERGGLAQELLAKAAGAANRPDLERLGELVGERLPDVAPPQRSAAALGWLARSAPDWAASDRAALVDAALGVLDHPDWAEVFGPASLAEVPIAALVGTRLISGTIDRLLITPDTVRIVDFKTDRRPPASLDAIATPYLRQMAAYVAALRVIHPGRSVQAALLFTTGPALFVLPDALIAAQKLELDPAQESF